MDLLTLFFEFCTTTLDRFFIAAVRGGIVLGLIYYIFWKLYPNRNKKYQIPFVGNVAPNPKREALFTFTSFFIYSIVTAIVLYISKFTSYSRMYLKIEDYGIIYTVLSVPIFMLYSDMMFYWSHRLMHAVRFFNRAHVLHHKFINVTPWAAFSFHAGEALINSFSFFLLMLLFPWHPVPFVIFVVISVAYNGYIHLGYDFTPTHWRTHFIMKWLNTPTHHSYHHHKSGYNFSFIFTIWDKLMKTEALPNLTETQQEQEKSFQKL